MSLGKGDPQKNFEAMEYLVRGPKGEEGTQGERGERGQRGEGMTQGTRRAIVAALDAERTAFPASPRASAFSASSRMIPRPPCHKPVAMVRPCHRFPATRLSAWWMKAAWA